MNRPLNRLTLACAAATGVAALLVAPHAAAQTDITGTWVVAVESPQGQSSIEASFKQTGEKLTGQVESPMGKIEFSGTMIKRDLLVSYSVPVQGSALEVKMTGVLDGEQLSGTIDFGGMAQAPWTAKRKPASEAAPLAPAAASVAPPRTGAQGPDVTGTWEVTMRLPQAEFPMSVTLTQDGETVSGSLAGPMGLMPLTGTMMGKRLTLEFKAATPQGDQAIVLTGELGPEGLKGKTTMPGVGEAEWVAKRVQ